MPQNNDNSFPRDAGRFAAKVNEGGATYSLLSQQFTKLGDKGYMVGGHPSPYTGKRVPEVVHEGPLQPHQAAAHMVRVAIETRGDREAYVGGWREGDRSVLDASTRVADKREALRIGRQRNERSVYGLEKGDEPSTGFKGSSEVPAAERDVPHPKTRKTKRGTALVAVDWAPSGVSTGSK